MFLVFVTKYYSNRSVTYTGVDYNLSKKNNKGADQTARKRRLVCAYVVSTQQTQVFSRCGSFILHKWQLVEMKKSKKDSR